MRRVFWIVAFAGARKPRPFSASAAAFERWPDIPIHVLTGTDDRFFPIEFHRVSRAKGSERRWRRFPAAISSIHPLPRRARKLTVHDASELVGVVEQPVRHMVCEIVEIGAQHFHKGAAFSQRMAVPEFQANPQSDASDRLRNLWRVDRNIIKRLPRATEDLSYSLII